MRQANRTRLEKYRSFYTCWVEIKSLSGIDAAGKNEIQDIIRQEWDPDYTCMMWCGNCVVNMIVFAFERMDAWVRDNTFMIKSSTMPIDSPYGFNATGITEIIKVNFDK